MNVLIRGSPLLQRCSDTCRYDVGGFVLLECTQYGRDMSSACYGFILPQTLVPSTTPAHAPDALERYVPNETAAPPLYQEAAPVLHQPEDLAVPRQRGAAAGNAPLKSSTAHRNLRPTI